MSILSTPAFGPRTALGYITVGALMNVWTSVWYFVFVRSRASDAVSPREWFWLIGLFLTGLTLVAIGLLLGSIGRAARRAELPPPEAIPAEATIQRTEAATPVPAPAAMPQVVQPAGVPVAPVAQPQAVPPAAVAQPQVVMPRA